MKKYRDYYFQQAKKEDYRARSVYKLKEIDEKFRLIKPGMKVLDLGCAPGSWLQYCLEKVGDKGKVVGFDITEVKPVPRGAKVIQADVFQLKPEDIEDRPFDCVLSDMAPSTTGAKSVDHFRSVELCRKAFDIAGKTLKTGGSFVCKIFQGEDFEVFVKEVKIRFESVKIFKPTSSRSESKEIFIIAKGFMK